jgi:hypothetical protein
MPVRMTASIKAGLRQQKEKICIAALLLNEMQRGFRLRCNMARVIRIESSAQRAPLLLHPISHARNAAARNHRDRIAAGYFQSTRIDGWLAGATDDAAASTGASV